MRPIGQVAAILLCLCAATAARAGTCTGKQNGLWCAGSDLVYCSGGNVSWKVQCDAGCKSMPAGTPDQCNPGFCNGKQTGLWCKGNDLVYCKSGGIQSSTKCSNGCQSMPPGTPDKCKSGCSGFCCGKQSGLWCDGSKLVNCQGGAVKSSSNCEHGCQQMPTGTNDKCKSGCSGFCCGKQSGLWCDGSKLVNCQGGKVSSSQTCQHGCQQMPTGTPDKCKSGCSGFCCGKANGLWCDGSKLVNCQGGNVASSQTCKDGCQQMPAGTPDKCKTPQTSGFCSGKANGLWCDGDQLVNCQGGQKASSSTCAHGCKSNPPGVADACQAPPTSGGSGQLSMCNPFSPAKSVTCSFGCYNGHMGSDYACADGTKVHSPIAGKVTYVKNSVPGQTCKPDFGNYIKIGQGSYEVFLAHLRKDIQVKVGQEVKAGQHVAYASNSGYTLTLKGGQWVCQQGGGYHLHLEVRKSGKAFDPYKSSNIHWTSCSNAGGGGGGGTKDPDWCDGKQSGKWCKSDALVVCQSGVTTSTTSCAHGCQENPPGVPDACKPAPGFCSWKADGKWCEGDKLITCKSKAKSGEAVCPYGCDPKPDGVDDQCKPKPTWCSDKADGKHCKGNFAVTCKGGQQLDESPCNNGCGELGAGKGAGCLPVVLDAFCGDKSDGTWCGDGGVVVECLAGKKKGTTTCPFGCDGKGPGPDDACKDPPTPTDPCHLKADGSWCSDTAVLTCKDKATLQAQVCSKGCDGPPGAAFCKQDVEQPKEFCDGKVSGDWCNGPTLVTCKDGQTLSAKLCTKGCISKGDGQPDECDEPPICEAKVEGKFCDGGSKLVTCTAGKQVKSEVCVGGCVEVAAGQAWCQSVDVGTDAGTVGIGDVMSGGQDGGASVSDGGSAAGEDGAFVPGPDGFVIQDASVGNAAGGSSSGCSAGGGEWPSWWIFAAAVLLLFMRRSRRDGDVV